MTGEKTKVNGDRSCVYGNLIHYKIDVDSCGTSKDSSGDGVEKSMSYSM